MPASQRRQAASVIEQLLRDPQQFSFFQAVRLLDRWLASSSPDGQGLSKLNFRNSLSLAFPPSEVESLLVHKKAPATPSADDQAIEADKVASPSMLDLMLANAQPEALPRHPGEVERIDLTPAFMGLLGVCGTLPLFYTETLAQREAYQKDYAARAFMDIFSHRAVTMFYQAWRKHRLDVQYEADQRNSVLPWVLALAGMGHKGLRDRLQARLGGVADESLAYHAGALQQRTVSARRMQRLLEDYLRVPVRIDQFVGRWYELPEQARFHLGQARRQGGGLGGLNGVLGKSAMLGERVWQRDLRLRLVLGPLTHEQFQCFLPGESGALALKEWLTLLNGVSLEYEVQLCLRQEDVKGASLESGRQSSMGRLGWDTFLQTKAANEDRADVRYDIHAAA